MTARRDISMDANEPILVTGASGMVGTALSEQLLDSNTDVIGADVVPNRWSTSVDRVTHLVDLREESSIESLPTDVDTVVHLAANARVRKLVEHPSRARDNFEMTYNVLEYVRKNDIPNMIFSSSREVYGNQPDLVRSEKDTRVDEGESPYTASKIGGEALVDAYARCYDFDASILRFSNVYGRYDVSDRVVPNFIVRADRGVDLPVFGEKILDFTYLDDCIQGVTLALQNFSDVAGETFNIASGKGSTIVDLADEIIERMNSSSNVRLEETRTGEVANYVGDISKAREMLGYEPTLSPFDGLDRTIQWYLNNDLLDSIEMVISERFEDEPVQSALDTNFRGTVGDLESGG